MVESRNQAYCPTPLFHDQFIVLGHGSGGKLTANLIQRVFHPLLSNRHLDAAEDAADLEQMSGRCVVTTDSYVVKPVFFRGGNIGSLAVHGTINDLAVRGARPLYITAGFILEEGLSIEELTHIVEAMAGAAAENNITVVAADTKVVNRGAGDKVFINTTGIGELMLDPPPAAARVQAGDVVIVSGDIGRHGMAIMCEREGLEIESSIESDSCSLSKLVADMVTLVPSIHCMRDLTRGGLGTVLNEVASSANLGIDIQESCIPVSDGVRAACELLGLDPLYVACEGRLAAFVPPAEAEKLLARMQSHVDGESARVIGKVTVEHPRKVVMQSTIGGRRIVDKLSGEQLPRIC